MASKWTNINDQRTAVYHCAAKRCSFATHFEHNFEQSGVILWTLANKVKAVIRIYGRQKEPKCCMQRKAINILSLEPCEGNCALRNAMYVNFTAFFALSVQDMRHILSAGGKWGDRPRPRSWGGPALQASDVDDQSTLEIKQIIVFNSCLHVIWKMTIIISLLGQRHYRHVIISIKKPLYTNRKKFYEWKN